MTKKKSDSKKLFSKNVAKVLTATMAASTVVAVLPADFTKASMSQGGSVTDAVYNQPLSPSTNVTGAVYTETTPVPVPTPAPVTPAPTPELEVPIAPVPVVPIPEVIVQPSVQALDTVRNAKSAATLQKAMTAAELALNLTGYKALSPEDQAAVAQALLSSPYKEGYTDTAAVQQALNKVVAAQRDAAALRNAVAAVNSAGSAAQMQSALEAPYLGLVMMNYKKLSDNGKLTAAEAVRKAVPAGGFMSRADIQKVFNGAVAPVIQSEAK